MTGSDPETTEAMKAPFQAIGKIGYATSLASVPYPVDLPALIDDNAVAVFSRAMRDKMETSRAKGREGWQTCPVDALWEMLHEHVSKGDPVDIANLAMMIWHNQKRSAETHE